MSIQELFRSNDRKGSSPRLALLLAMTVLAAACSRESKIYPDPAPVTIMVDPPISTDGRSPLPQGFYNQSVNQSLVDVALDGITSTSNAIRLQTLSGSNADGGFNGSGTGNRALLGLAAYGGQPLTSLTDLTFDAKTVDGTEKLSVLLLVDPACDGTSIRVFVADGAAIGAGTDLDGGYARYSAKPSETKWAVRGAAIQDPGDASVTLVPSAGVSTDSLTAFSAKFPSACIRNAASGDSDLPKNLPTAGVLFALGDASTTTINSAFINRISVGSDVYEGVE